MEAVQGVPRVLTSGGSTYRDYEATRAELDRARAHLNLIASRDVIDAVNVYAGVWRDMNRAALGEGNLDVEAFVESAEQGEHELFLMNAMRDQLPEFAGALAAAEEHVNEAMRRDIGTWEDERKANDPDVADRRGGGVGSRLRPSTQGASQAGQFPRDRDLTGPTVETLRL